MSRHTNLNRIIKEHQDDEYLDDQHYDPIADGGDTPFVDVNEPYIREVRQFLKGANISDKYIIKTLKQYEYDSAATTKFILENHDAFKDKNKSKTVSKPTKPKTMEELLKNFSDIVPLSSVQESNSTKTYTQNVITTSEDLEVSLVVIGHVDAGKSTLVGQLMGLVQEELMREFAKFKKLSQQMNKNTFEFAWNTDGMEDERIRGITIDQNEKSLSITPEWVNNNKNNLKNSAKMKNNFKVTFQDCPGHKDFVSNMIGGVSNADAAMLIVDVVDFTKNQSWKSFQFKPQTLEHIRIVKNLGIFQLIVAFNKIDMLNPGESQENLIQYEEDFMNQIKDEFDHYLTKQIGFKPDNIQQEFVSGYRNYNLQSIIERIGMLKFRPPTVKRPMQLAVQDFYNQEHKSKPRVQGKLTEGIIESNAGKTQYYLTSSNGYQIKAKVISINGKPKISQQSCGNQEVELDFVNKDVTQFIKSPCVLCDWNLPIPLTKKIVASVQTFQLKQPLIQGQVLIMHLQQLQQSVRVSHLLSVVVPKTKDSEEKEFKHPRCVNSHRVCKVELASENGGEQMSLELFELSKNWGRFVLRSEGETVGCGMVVEIF